MAHLDHFNWLAPFYDRLIKPTDPAHFIGLAGLPSAGILLDVGGGTGQKSYRLSHLVKTVVIADESRGMLAQAHKKAGLQPVRSFAERLPFEDEIFERVIIVDALHHVVDHQLTMCEMWRVVKPGGRIVIEEPDIRYVPVKLMAAIEKIALMRSHFIDPPGIAAAFNYPNAKVAIEIEGTTAWIVIDKLAE